MPQPLDKTITDLVERSYQLPVIGILIRAAVDSKKDMSKDMAASIAYFTFLSLFPLILGIVAIGGFFLKSAEAQAWVNVFIAELFPVSADFVTRNIESIVKIRGAAGLTSVVVLMWSGSKMVAALSRGINSALGLERPYAAYLSKLRNFGLTLTVTILIFITIAVTPIIEILNEFELEIIGNQWNAFFDLIAGHAAGFAITAVLLGVIYRLVPFERQKWKDLLPGIFAAGLLIELGKELFAFYIENVSRYDTIYGSLSSIIVLLIWLYVAARAVLYGTEVICVYRSKLAQDADGRNINRDPKGSE